MDRQLPDMGLTVNAVLDCKQLNWNSKSMGTSHLSGIVLVLLQKKKGCHTIIYIIMLLYNLLQPRLNSYTAYSLYMIIVVNHYLTFHPEGRMQNEPLLEI